MIRGTTNFKCPKCGKVFEAPDIEDNATVATMPMPCPCCGTKSRKVGIDSLLSILFNNKN